MFFPENRIKQYVEVTALHGADGSAVPLSIRTPDGRTFKVSRVVGRPVVDDDFAIRGRTVRYTVRIGRKRAWVYREFALDDVAPSDRWFVAAKADGRTEPDASRAHLEAIAR